MLPPGGSGGNITQSYHVNMPDGVQFHATICYNKNIYDGLPRWLNQLKTIWGPRAHRDLSSVTGN